MASLASRECGKPSILLSSLSITQHIKSMDTGVPIPIVIITVVHRDLYVLKDVHYSVTYHCEKS